MADYFNHPRRNQERNTNNHRYNDQHKSFDERNSDDEEFSREWDASNVDEMEDFRVEMRNLSGWIALILSVLSFFFLPIILGALGIIVGFFARHRNAVWLGNTAIVVGAISIILALFVRPFLY